jgi:hypothetical protein
MEAGKLKRTMKETKEKRWYNIFKASKYILNAYLVFPLCNRKW